MNRFFRKLSNFRFEKIPHYLWQYLKIPLDSLHVVYDWYHDLRICGISLTKTVPTSYAESMGATDSEPTHYRYLERIYADSVFSADDCFLDVGCGKGRVLAFHLLHKFPGHLTGIELEDSIAEVARSWSTKFRNVEVITGNALDIDLYNFNVFNLARPFELDVTKRFLSKMENEVQKPIRLYSYYDNNNHFLDGRAGWTVVRRETLGKLRVFDWLPLESYFARYPQRYTVWKYDPQDRKDSMTISKND